jgi:membrane protein implicated in regulation of membrane protease activity
MSFGIVAGVAFLVIALTVFASPLIAVFLFVIAAIVLLIGMSAMRQRSRAAEQSDVSKPGTGPAGPRAQGTRGRRASGAPASGEGEIS